MQVLLVNEAISVLVNHVEGLLKLLDLGLVKHHEDIGSGPLWPLLGGFGLGLLTGHLGFRWVGLPWCGEGVWLTVLTGCLFHGICRCQNLSKCPL